MSAMVERTQKKGLSFDSLRVRFQVKDSLILEVA